MSGKFGSSGAGMLWLMQADRDGMHPVAMGYAHAFPYRLDLAPGAWDAVSDLLLARRPPDSPEIARIVGGPAHARHLARFASMADRLPPPERAIGIDGNGPCPLPPGMGPGLGLAHAVRIVRLASGLSGEGGRADAAVAGLFGHAVDSLDRPTAAWVGRLARNRGMHLDDRVPEVARYLEREEPHRVANRLD